MKIGLIGINKLDQEEYFKLIHQSLGKNLKGIFSHSEEILPICSNYNIKLFQSTGELFEKIDGKNNIDNLINELWPSINMEDRNAVYDFVENINERMLVEEIV